MCGWFWELKTSFFGEISGEKIWVVLHDNMLHVYDSINEINLIEKIDCHDIADIEEKVFNKLEISMQELTIKFKNKNRGDLLWAWGEDASKVKGLWRRSLVRNHHHYQVSSTTF